MDKKFVLVVDDDLGVRETLPDVLEISGFDTSVVDSGMECLKALEYKNFDVVLLDLKMPGMSGLETLEKIKKMDKKIRVIMMTAYVNDVQVKEAASEGVFSVVFKPLDLDNLISLIDAA